jgi:uncharacterized membrane protein HdeD (DUF308 family)
VPIRITVSYRRSDSPYAARGIRARFAEHFGKENVFMDIDSIALGVDYRIPIAEALARSDVVAVVIGPKWSGQREGGKPRLFDSNDPVRHEIAAALSAERILVIPLLVDGATMPGEEDLPENLKALAYRNATEIDSGRDFETHVDRVIRSIEFWKHVEIEGERRNAEEESERPRGAPDVEPQRATVDAAERQHFAAAAESEQLAIPEAEPQPPAARGDERGRLAAATEDRRVGSEAAEPMHLALETPRAVGASGRTHSWPLLLRALIAISVSILLLTFGDMNTRTKILFFGALVLLDGIIALIQALPAGHSGNGKRWLTLGQGVFGIVIVVIAFLFTSTMPPHVIAIWAIVTGILEISAAVRLRRSLPDEFNFLVAHGALSVVLGVKFVVDSFSVRSLGIYALVSGFTLIIGLLVRRRNETVEVSSRAN